MVDSCRRRANEHRDGKADYVWTRKTDGQARVWYNNYPNQPVWRPAGVFATANFDKAEANGHLVRYARMTHTGRASYVLLDPDTGALAAWLNGCDDLDNDSGFAIPPLALPQHATADELKFQPAMDFDKDGCYNVPAIDAKGNLAQGLPEGNVSPSSGCHDLSDLDNNNVYVRTRCENDWCLHMYDYYFEKDVAEIGHRHDWEHIGVWTHNGNLWRVYASAHGGWSGKEAGKMRMDGTHPKIVYHKDEPATHAFRFAEEHDEDPENGKNIWFRGSLVNYDGFPGNTRDTLFKHDWGDAHIKIKDESWNKDTWCEIVEENSKLHGAWDCPDIINVPPGPM